MKITEKKICPSILCHIETTCSLKQAAAIQLVSLILTARFLWSRGQKKPKQNEFGLLTSWMQCSAYARSTECLWKVTVTFYDNILKFFFFIFFKWIAHLYYCPLFFPVSGVSKHTWVKLLPLVDNKAEENEKSSKDEKSSICCVTHVLAAPSPLQYFCSLSKLNLEKRKVFLCYWWLCVFYGAIEHSWFWCVNVGWLIFIP